MSGNESNSSTPTPSETKLCHIVKRPDFDGYGFNLHSEKIKPGQFIGKVDANSPALLAGLKEGDRIIEVNGVPIGSETHKQVVQRIKAIANEVRLLLIDVDGATQKSAPAKADVVDVETKTKDGDNLNNNIEEYHGSVQEIPGASANISTISMISTKRMSNSSSNGSQTSTATAVPVLPPVVPVLPPVVPVLPPVVPKGDDVTDRGYKKNGTDSNGDVGISTIEPHTKLQHGNNSITNNNHNNNNVMTPLPPSAAVASAPQHAASTTTPMSGNGNKAGSLQLPMTAAEMRAKLMSKKKYDPKNESVDLKKKFEIIQKL